MSVGTKEKTLEELNFYVQGGTHRDSMNKNGEDSFFNRSIRIHG